MNEIESDTKRALAELSTKLENWKTAVVEDPEAAFSLEMDVLSALINSFEKLDALLDAAKGASNEERTEMDD